MDNKLKNKESIYLEYINQGEKVIVPVNSLAVIEATKKGNNAPLLVQINDFYGYFKNSKNSNSSFDDLEYVICQIGKLFGVRVAETYKLYKNGECLGIISKSVVKDNERLYMVDEFKNLFKSDNRDFVEEVKKIEKLSNLYLKKFKRSNGTEISLPIVVSEEDIKVIIELFLDILKCLGISEEEYNEIKDNYFIMILFDYLINNIDRNQTNFGVKVNEEGLLSFSELFDNATIEIPYIPNGYQCVNGFFVNKDSLLNCLYNNFYADFAEFSRQIIDNDEINKKNIKTLCEENLEETVMKWFFEKLKENYSKIYHQEIKKKDNSKLNYCFHTHTFRCGHTGISDIQPFFSDDEFVKCARENGILQLGFSDHAPTLDLGYHDENERMHISEVDEYIDSIKCLKKNYSDMQILCGFEADFDPMKIKFLIDLREKVDYMILGQHFVSNINEKNNPNYPLDYAEVVCQGIQSGIFDILAHPDIFMNYRDAMDGVNYDLFLENALIASRKICMKAKEYGVPIEINLREVLKERIMKDGLRSYPHPLFWNVAIETQVPVIYGLDAHFPKMFNNIEDAKKDLNSIINIDNLNLISEFNPVLARINNNLDDLLDEQKQNGLTYEANFVDKIIMDTRIVGEFDLIEFLKSLNKKLDRVWQNCIDEYALRKGRKKEKILIMQDDLKEKIEEREYWIKLIERSLLYLDETLEKQQELILNIKKLLKSLECSYLNKEELKRCIVQTVENYYTKNNNGKSFK